MCFSLRVYDLETPRKMKKYIYIIFQTLCYAPLETFTKS